MKGPKNVTCVKMRWHSAALFYLADLRLLVATRDDIFWLANLKLKQVARIKNRSRYLLGNRKHSGSKARILRACDSRDSRAFHANQGPFTRNEVPFTLIHAISRGELRSFLLTPDESPSEHSRFWFKTGHMVNRL